MFLSRAFACRLFLCGGNFFQQFAKGEVESQVESFARPVLDIPQDHQDIDGVDAEVNQLHVLPGFILGLYIVFSKEFLEVGESHFSVPSFDC